jgi:thioredoxin reductase (NADPH)
MTTTKQSITETRREQIFPVLEPAEIERIRRFGTLRSYGSGGVIAETGKPLEGLAVILSGAVKVTRRTRSSDGELIVAHGPGSFLGELAQLSGRPALVDAARIIDCRGGTW